MITFTGTTALDFWRWFARTDSGSPEDSHARTSTASLKTPGLREALLESEHFRESEPVEVVVGDKRFANNKEPLVCLVRSNRFPEHSFCQIDKDVLVVSPELLFIEMSGRMDLTDLVKFGCELVSNYSMGPRSQIFLDDRSLSFVKCKPLTTVKKLSAYIYRMKGYPSARKASRALDLVFENSASPMETNLALLLCMPRRLGGFGIPRPVLNHEVMVDRRKSEGYGRHSFVFDLFWKEGMLDVEYDSSQFHSSVKKLQEDSYRRNAIKRHGYDVITVTNDEFFSTACMVDIAKNISKSIGHRFQRFDLEKRQRVDDLRNRLMKDPFGI